MKETYILQRIDIDRDIIQHNVMWTKNDYDDNDEGFIDGTLFLLLIFYKQFRISFYIIRHGWHMYIHTYRLL